MESIAYISIGANIGDRIGNIEKAIDQINKHVGKVIQQSSIYVTEPFGFSSDDDFLNLCISIRTSISPDKLLESLKKIEIELGRKAKSKNGVYESRKIDLDIILYGSRIFNSEGLTIPHPRYKERRFVLEPLSEIAPEACDPINGKTIKQLAIECTDQSSIKFYEY